MGHTRWTTIGVLKETQDRLSALGDELEKTNSDTVKYLLELGENLVGPDTDPNPSPPDVFGCGSVHIGCVNCGEYIASMEIPYTPSSGAFDSISITCPTCQHMWPAHLLFAAGDREMDPTDVRNLLSDEWDFRFDEEDETTPNVSTCVEASLIMGIDWVPPLDLWVSDRQSFEKGHLEQAEGSTELTKAELTVLLALDMTDGLELDGRSVRLVSDCHDCHNDGLHLHLRHPDEKEYDGAVDDLLESVEQAFVGVNELRTDRADSEVSVSWFDVADSDQHVKVFDFGHEVILDFNVGDDEKCS